MVGVVVVMVMVVVQVSGSLVEDSRDPGVRTHRKAGQGEPRRLQSPGQAPAWEVGVTWAELELWVALGR